MQIWNETVRLKLGLPEPIPDTMCDTLMYRETFIKAFLTTCYEEQKKYDKYDSKYGVKKEMKSDLKEERKPEKKVDLRSEIQKIVDDKTTRTLMVGKVLKLINQNYGIGFCARKSRDGSYKFAHVLFDVFDVWRWDKTLQSLGKSLQDELSVGGLILINAIDIEAKENVKRNIQYMATAVVAAESLGKLKHKQFPSEAVLLENADKVEASKINNFKMVVNAVCNIDLDDHEQKLIKDLETELGLHKVSEKNEKIREEVKNVIKEELKASEEVSKNEKKREDIPVVENEKEVGGLPKEGKKDATIKAEITDNDGEELKTQVNEEEEVSDDTNKEEKISEVEVEDSKMQVIEELDGNIVNDCITSQDNSHPEPEQGNAGKVEDSTIDGVEESVSDNLSKTEETVSESKDIKIKSESPNREINIELKDSSKDIKTETLDDFTTNHVDDEKKKEDECTSDEVSGQEGSDVVSKDEDNDANVPLKDESNSSLDSKDSITDALDDMLKAANVVIESFQAESL